ncbi:hypothetical protein Lederberg_4 [Pelagibacter phage Lederberg EXVC029P]|nr:hypothetical protein Lederberg_4 [Pelagibacter phage Lederberg EXVC029P]
MAITKLDLTKSSTSASQNSINNLVKISSSSANDDATSIEVTSGLDSTYDAYIIRLIGMSPASDNQHCTITFTTDGTNFNRTVTTNGIESQNNEGGSGFFSGTQGAYKSGSSTNYFHFARNCSSDADHVFDGEINLFNPSSTSVYKNFYSKITNKTYNDFMTHTIGTGEIRETSAITGFKISFQSGNMTGTVILYGVKT